MHSISEPMLQRMFIVLFVMTVTMEMALTTRFSCAVARKDVLSEQHKSRMEDAIRFSQEKNLPQELRKRVFGHMEFQYKMQVGSTCLFSCVVGCGKGVGKACLILVGLLQNIYSRSHSHMNTHRTHHKNNPTHTHTHTHTTASKQCNSLRGPPPNSGNQGRILTLPKCDRKMHRSGWHLRWLSPAVHFFAAPQVQSLVPDDVGGCSQAE